MKEKMQYLGHETHGLKNGGFYEVYTKDWIKKRVTLLNEYGEPQEVDVDLLGEDQRPIMYIEEDVQLDGMEEEDIINKPNHYHKGGFDVWDILDAKFSQEMREGFYAGNVMKYCIRYKDKGQELNDLRKLVAYGQKLLQTVEGGEGENDAR